MARKLARALTPGDVILIGHKGIRTTVLAAPVPDPDPLRRTATGGRRRVRVKGRREDTGAVGEFHLNGLSMAVLADTESES